MHRSREPREPQGCADSIFEMVYSALEFAVITLSILWALAPFIALAVIVLVMLAYTSGGTP